MPECQAAPPRTVRCRTDDAARHEYRNVSANDNQSAFACSALGVPLAAGELFSAWYRLFPTHCVRDDPVRGRQPTEFELGDILQAYDTFGKAADTKAPKVIIDV